MLHLGTETEPPTTATTPAAADPPASAALPEEYGAMPDEYGAVPCDLVTVPARQGLEAVDILRREAEQRVGPVLHDGACDTLGFLVPPGTADAWDVPGSACTRTAGRGLRIPAEPPVLGSGWLLPEADAPVTDPADLRVALDRAARLIEAADSCR